MSILRLVDPQQFYESILDVKTPKAHDPSDIKTIRKWTKRVVRRQKEKMEYDQMGIFSIFSSDLLTANVRSGPWSIELIDWLNNEVIELSSLPSRKQIQSKLKRMRYRFPPRGARKIEEVAGVFLDKFNGDWSQYFRKARNYPYTEDPFLDVYHVARKTRDLAVSNFVLEYPTIDVHVARVLRRSGLVCHCYGLGIELKTSERDGYEELSQLCVELSRQISVKPVQLDRALWHFGRSVCSSKPKCDKCPATSICMYYPLTWTAL